MKLEEQKADLERQLKTLTKQIKVRWRSDRGSGSPPSTSVGCPLLGLESSEKDPDYSLARFLIVHFRGMGPNKCWQEVKSKQPFSFRMENSGNMKAFPPMPFPGREMPLKQCLSTAQPVCLCGAQGTRSPAGCQLWRASDGGAGPGLSRRKPRSGGGSRPTCRPRWWWPTTSSARPSRSCAL